MGTKQHPKPATAAVTLLLLLLLACCCAPRTVHAQGLRREKDALGSSETYTSLQDFYKNSKGFRAAYKVNRAGACSGSSSSLCAAQVDSKNEDILRLAASPLRYDGRSQADTGGLALMTPVRDQGNCDSCTAFVVTAAAEIAVAAALRRASPSPAYSAQDLHFCGASGAAGEQRTCGSSSFTMKQAIEAFYQAVSSGPGVVLEKCLPYDAPSKRGDSDSYCDYKCKDSDSALKAGTFKFKRLTNVGAIQAWIRQWGSVMTRLEIYSDFKPFFQKNPGGTYTGPAAGATLLEPHAVLLVGYDNEQERWLIRNSWGPTFATGGYAWVSYASTAKLDLGGPDDTYGLRFAPLNPPSIPFALFASAQQKGCYWLEPPKGSWPAAIADQFEIPIQRVLSDNIERIPDLEKPLDGKAILLCGVSDAVIKRTKGGGGGAPPTPTPAPGPAPSPAPAPASPAPSPPPPAKGGCDSDSVPGPVQNLKIAGNTAAAGGDADVSLAWDPPSGGGCVAGYEVQAVNTDTGASTKQALKADAKGLKFNGAGGAAYLFDVTAVNDAGNSPPKSVTVTTAGGRR